VRENRPHGSEGGGTELNQSSLPLCAPVKAIEQTGESPVQSHRYGSEAEGNCVFNRKGGKQLEANEQSVTEVNAIRPSLSGSVLARREPLTSHHDPDAARLRVAD